MLFPFWRKIMNRSDSSGAKWGGGGKDGGSWRRHCWHCSQVFRISYLLTLSRCILYLILIFVWFLLFGLHIADMISMACPENINQPDCRTAVETPYEFLEALANRIDRCLQNQKWVMIVTTLNLNLISWVDLHHSTDQLLQKYATTVCYKSLLHTGASWGTHHYLNQDLRDD